MSVRDIISAIDIAVRHPASYDEAPSAMAPTLLALKLKQGGCGPTTVTAAEALAEHWRMVRRDALADVPGSLTQFAAIERRLLVEAGRCQDAASSSATGTTYGVEMWDRLNDKMLDDLLPDVPLPRDGTLALGGVCDLASQCKVWFSPQFDVLKVQASAIEAGSRSTS